MVEDDNLGGPGPLGRIRVLDLTSVVMGPLATQILGDLGADVVTIEHAAGDRNRSMGDGPLPQLSGVALNLLRNKRNVSLDVATDEGRSIVLRLAATCDVVVTNLRPGSLRRLGLDYDSVRAVRADVVYCQAAGYPSDGPRADEPAYDDVIQAATGIADVMSRVVGHPTLVPTLIADKVAGLTIAYAVCAALVHRATTGQGQRVEVPMVDVVTSFMLTEHGSGAIAEPPQDEAGYRRILTPQRRPKPTADGWIHVLPYSRENWTALLAEVGREDVTHDERFANMRARHENSEFLYGELETIMPAKTTDEWMTFCAANGIPASRVGSLQDIVAELPIEHHPLAGDYRVIPPPVRFDETPASVRLPAPIAGQHNEEVLRQLGYSDEEIAALTQTGVLRSAPTDSHA